MSKTPKSIRGMHDVLPDDTPAWQRLETALRDTAAAFGYEEIRMPIVEQTALFARSIGEVTDIVEKEMYTFDDRNGDSLTLRPEGTAGCVRACLQHGIIHNQQRRLWYTGPMFRHERPQKGRYRQFHQVGVEALGSDSPVLDAEVIQTLLALFDAVDARGLTLLLNSIGCPACRPGFLASLGGYLAEHATEIPPAFQDRITTNPLRLYDAKDEAVQTIMAGHAPITEHLCEDCRDHHAEVKACLEDLEIAYEEDPTLVRGLDYYTRTTFEVTARSERKQSSLAGGGRYDGLIEQCGGPPTPGIGFSVGVERTLLHLADDPVDLQRSRQSVVDVYVACVGPDAERYALTGADILRDICRVEVDTSGRSLKAQAKAANQRLARVLLIAGDEEIEQKVFQLKQLDTGAQRAVARDHILTAVREVLEQ